MSYSMMGFNPYSGFGGQGLFGGMPQYGGGFPQMGGYGGFNPYGGFGGYGGGFPGYQMQPYNPYGNSQFGGGFLDQFQAQLNDMFTKYFDTKQMPGDSTTGDTTGAAPAPGPQVASTNATYSDPTPEHTSVPIDITGKHYLKTGEFSKGAQQKIQDSYGSTEAFMQSEQGQGLASQQQAMGGRDPNNKPGVVSAGKLGGGLGPKYK